MKGPGYNSRGGRRDRAWVAQILHEQVGIATDRELIKNKRTITGNQIGPNLLSRKIFEKTIENAKKSGFDVKDVYDFGIKVTYNTLKKIYKVKESGEAIYTMEQVKNWIDTFYIEKSKGKKFDDDAR